MKSTEIINSLLIINQLFMQPSINQLRAELSAQWQLRKAKNAKPGQPVRDYDKIKELHSAINALKG